MWKQMLLPLGTIKSASHDSKGNATATGDSYVTDEIDAPSLKRDARTDIPLSNFAVMNLAGKLIPSLPDVSCGRPEDKQRC